MRGRYFRDDYAREPINPARVTVTGLHFVTGLQPESAEDRNARENAAKQLAGNGPQIIPSPAEPASAEDIRAIVRAVAIKVLRSEVDYHGVDQLAETYYPELRGITAEQISAVIAEDLS